MQRINHLLLMGADGSSTGEQEGLIQRGAARATPTVRSFPCSPLIRRQTTSCTTEEEEEEEAEGDERESV